MTLLKLSHRSRKSLHKTSHRFLLIILWVAFLVRFNSTCVGETSTSQLPALLGTSFIGERCDSFDRRNPLVSSNAEE